MLSCQLWGGAGTTNDPHILTYLGKKAPAVSRGLAPIEYLPTVPAPARSLWPEKPAGVKWTPWFYPVANTALLLQQHLPIEPSVCVHARVITSNAHV